MSAESEWLHDPYVYRCRVERILDGDTMDVMVDRGFNDFTKMRIRVRNIDTPETWRPKTEDERAHGKEATAFVESQIPVGSECFIRSFYFGVYGRIDAILWYVLDGKELDLGEQLKLNGFEKRENYVSIAQ